MEIDEIWNESETTKDKLTGRTAFFQLKKEPNRWWLMRPSGEKYFSLGMNHVDPATLRYPENLHIWRKVYGNSMEHWLKESVAPNLEDWGFNCLGWNQEVVTRGKTNHRHSRHFTYDEYQWLDMPYCHQLPFADFHWWENETRYPDFYSDGFAAWCDHVAREHCAVMAGDPKLIGYFYIDCPTWLFIGNDNEWKGPYFDPKMLESKVGKEEITEVTGQYYKVCHDAVRRYDPNHLILGDRYEANWTLDISIMEGARPYVDVLCFQDFKDPVGNLDYWYKETGMPVLWADGSKNVTLPDGRKTIDGDAYGEILKGLTENPGCVGAHLCGAYLSNRVRRKGLLDENVQPYTEPIQKIRKVHRQVEAWVREQV